MVVDTGRAAEPHRKWSVRRRVGVTLGTIAAVLVLAVIALYAWPLGSDRLENARPNALTFEQASQEAASTVQADSGNSDVLAECRSQALVHEEKTAKAVLMLHGYTSCPKDYVELAQVFYDEGYNVYVPREPHHGLQNVATSSDVEANALVEYADESMDVVAGLGTEVGVIGMSGGGVLATWLAENRTDSVSHLLALSPFYQPDSSQAPPLALKPLTVLFGFRVLPDRNVGDTNFTLSGLGQYLRIVANLEDEPKNPKLRSVAVAWSDKDPYIDQDVAVERPENLTDANGLKLATHEFPPELNLPHNIAAAQYLGDRAEETYQLYLDLYEG